MQQYRIQTLCCCHICVYQVFFSGLALCSANQIIEKEQSILLTYLNVLATKHIYSQYCLLGVKLGEKEREGVGGAERMNKVLAFLKATPGLWCCWS